jgi:DNA polymerase bacteriophage-type
LRGILHNRKGSIHDDMLEYDSRGILLPNGLRIRYPKLRRTDTGFEYISNSRTYKKLQLNGTLEDKEWTKIYGGKVTENIVQALARLVISEQMVELGKTHKVLFQVHDELILLADAKNYTKTQKHVETIMSTPPSWAGNLPVACESGVGNNYGDCK